MDATGRGTIFSGRSEAEESSAFLRLVKRQAFEQVAGWRTSDFCFQDWDLWLRITAGGWTMKLAEKAVLRYRVHPASMSANRVNAGECGARAISRAQLTTIVTLASGRSWALERWFAAIEAQQWDRENLHIVFVDNSRNDEFSATAKNRLSRCPIQHTYVRDDSRVVETTTSAEAADAATVRIKHQYPINVHLARLYSLASRYLPAATANVWSVEDDVEPPPDALFRLATELFRYQAGAVTGALRSRFNQNLLTRIETSKSISDCPRGTVEAAVTGFFCLLAKRDAWDAIAWRPGISGTEKIPYYDWAGSADIRSTGRKIYLCGDVRCRHWQADGTAVDV